MRRRVVFGSFGPPGWEDANSWAYNLFEELRGGPFELTFVELLTAADACYFRFLQGDDFHDPRRLGSILRCSIEEPVGGEQPALGDLLRSLAPDLIVAWGSEAARLLRRALPDTPLVLAVADCDPIERLIEERVVRDWMAFQAAAECGVAFWAGRDDADLDTFLAADLVVPVSALACAAFEHLPSSGSGRIYRRPLAPADLSFTEAERFAHLRRPFDDRDVDVLFAARSWTRRAANLRLAEKVCAALGDREVHLVGEIEGRVATARVHGATCRRGDLFALLGRTRVVVCPALAEAGPSILFEAAAMGCNVVASPNCGYAGLCNDELLARRCSPREFLERIRGALSHPYGDNRGSFLGGSAELVETLAVF
jgi:glycosyltransferase involved in cell wall biosynthesis